MVQGSQRDRGSSTRPPTRLRKPQGNFGDKPEPYLVLKYAYTKGYRKYDGVVYAPKLVRTTGFKKTPGKGWGGTKQVRFIHIHHSWRVPGTSIRHHSPCVCMVTLNKMRPRNPKGGRVIGSMASDNGLLVASMTDRQASHVEKTNDTPS